MNTNAPELKFKIKVNGKEVEDTFRTFKREYFKAQRQLDKSPIGSDNWKEAGKNLGQYKKLMDDAKKQQEEFIDQMKSDEEVVNDFTDSVGSLFTGFKRGNYKEIKAGFNGIAGSIKNVGKAALSLLANPVVLAAAVLAGVGLAVKEWSKYNKKIWKTAKLTEQVTGLVGEHAHEVRLHAKTISKVFDQDYKKILETANVLVKKFKISWSEALSSIEEGLIAGGVVNEEYLESLNEYAPFLADAGYSINEFKNIIAAGYDLGVFKDKLPDALKEFHLAMTEQGDTTRDALDNAFGISFTDKLFNGIKKGTITTKKALQEIIKESKKYGLSVQQQQQLTADLFKGAGEDAGGALKIFEAINIALEKQTIVLTPLQQMLKETADAHHELAIAKDEALRSDDYIVFAGEMDLVWTKIQTIFYKALSGIQGSFTDWNEFLVKQIVLFLASTKAMPKIVKSNFRLVIGSIKELIGEAFSFGDIFKKLISLDFDGAKKAAENYKKKVSESFDVVKTSAGGIVDEIKRIREEASKKVDLEFETRKQGFIDKAKLEEQQKAEEELRKRRSHITRKELEELRKRLQKEREFRELVILNSKGLLEQEEAAFKKRKEKAGLFRKEKNQMTTQELKALEILELQHQTNIAKIENEAINDHVEKLKKQHERDTLLREIDHNNQIAALEDIEEAKALLKGTLSDNELSEIKTLNDAKKALQRDFELTELDNQAAFYQKQIELMTSLLEGEETGINLGDKLLTDEQKELLNQRLDEVKLKLSEIGILENEEEDDPEVEGLKGEVDIFGFSIDDWENTFENLDTAKNKIKAVEMVVGGLQNVWGMYSEFLAANEAKQLKSFEKSNDKKKKALKKQLDSGIIDQETYNKEVEKLDQDLAKKKAEVEYKQAKREQISTLFGIAANTALGIAKAVAASPPTLGMPWTALIGAMGALQAGLVLAKPLPDKNNYADGGYTQGIGYLDETGHEVAGTVHANEYVIPEFVMNSTDPAIPQILEYVETKRKMKLGKFAEGGFTTTPPPEFKEDRQDTTEIEENDPSAAMLLFSSAVNRLLDEGLTAVSLIGDDEILRFDERLQKIKESRNNAKRQ